MMEARAEMAPSRPRFFSGQMASWIMRSEVKRLPISRSICLDTLAILRGWAFCKLSRE